MRYWNLCSLFPLDSTSSYTNSTWICIVVIGNRLWRVLFCKVHHSADDTNLLCLSNSIKKLNKLINADLKHLVNRLNVSKISLNVKKTEIVIFKSKQKKFEGDLKIKIMRY